MKEFELPRDLKSLEILLLNGPVKNRIIKVCEDTETQLNNDVEFHNCYFKFYHNSSISFNANQSNQNVYEADFIGGGFENCDNVWYGGKVVGG